MLTGDCAGECEGSCPAGGEWVRAEFAWTWTGRGWGNIVGVLGPTGRRVGRVGRACMWLGMLAAGFVLSFTVTINLLHT